MWPDRIGPAALEVLVHMCLDRTPNGKAMQILAIFESVLPVLQKYMSCLQERWNTMTVLLMCVFFGTSPQHEASQQVCNIEGTSPRIAASHQCQFCLEFNMKVLTLVPRLAKRLATTF